MADLIQIVLGIVVALVIVSLLTAALDWFHRRVEKDT